MDDDIEFVEALERRLVDGIADSRRTRRVRTALIAATVATVIVAATVAGVAIFRSGPDERLEGAAATSPTPVSSAAPDTSTSATSTSEPAPTTTLGAVPTAAEEPTTSASTSTTVPPCPHGENYQYPIRRCDSGFASAVIRARLVELGYLADAYPPWFDDATEDAVRRFQADHGLEPDGLVGPLTWRALAPDVQAPDEDGNGVVDPDEIILDAGACADGVVEECPTETAADD